VVLLGEAAAARLPLKAIRTFAAGLFVIIGGAVLLHAAQVF
jgi:putative Ca2+/H+ antiporter (TMEM165/GDT1 family)